MTKRPTMVGLAILALGAGACSGSSPEPAKAEAKPAAAVAEARPADTKTDAADAKTDAADAKAQPPAPVAAPPKPVGLVGGPLPAVEDVATPAVVFGAIVHRHRGEWEVDVVDFAGMDVKRLEKALEAQMHAEWKRRDDGEPRADELPNVFEGKDGKALVPAGFAVGDPWTLVTPAGAEHRTAKGLRAAFLEGSEQLHFYVQLGEAPAGTERPAVALRGHLPTTTRLAVPKPAVPEDVEPLVKALAPSLEPGALEILARKPIAATDVKLYPGRFPGQRTHAAFLTSDADDDHDPPISALLFAKADGSAEVVVVPDAFGTVELLGLLDVDGDGFDEVFYEDVYHEGWYVMMMQWEREMPRPRVLTGDGL